MQKHAYFVTTARGGIHDEDALAEALAASRSQGPGWTCGRTNHRRTITS